MSQYEYKDHEDLWNRFWRGILTNSDTDELDMGMLKRELWDFYVALTEVPKVYCHITGGRLSKVTYSAGTVIAEADEYYEKLYTEDKENEAEKAE